MSKKGPAFLKIYVIPVLLLNIAVRGWSAVAVYAAHGLLSYLCYAVIVTVG